MKRRSFLAHGGDDLCEAAVCEYLTTRLSILSCSFVFVHLFAWHSRPQFMSPFFTARAGEFFWLFSGARVDSDGAFAGALIGSFVFAVMSTIAMELLKRVERRAIASPAAKVPQALLGGAAQAVRLSLHYLAMLLIMTFNVWVFLVVVAGHGVGYTLFRLFGTVGAPVGGTTAATYGAVGETGKVHDDERDAQVTDCC